MTAVNFDVVVIGGGMVGAALASGLAQAGFSTAMVEAQQPPAFDPTADYDLRLSAISPGSQKLLTDIGAWPLLAEQRISAYQSMRVWEQGGTDELAFDALDSGLTELGHIIENRLIVDALWQRLDEVEVLCPARINQLSLQDDAAVVTLDDGRGVTAKLVVAADGGNSATREMAGIGCFGWSYHQRGIVANVQTEQSHEATAWQCFLPTGPVAFLPLQDGRCSIVWSATDALAEELLALDEHGFNERLTAGLEGRLGKVLSSGPRAAFPLRLQQAEAYVQPRLALVGDAAHVVHPLAGQGVNLGFGDAAYLINVLKQTRADGRDIGEYKRLRRYERPRKAEDALMATATDGLNRLYGSDNPLLQLGRRQGSRFINLLKPLKSALIQQAAS